MFCGEWPEPSQHEKLKRCPSRSSRVELSGCALLRRKEQTQCAPRRAIIAEKRLRQAFPDVLTWH